MALFGGRQKIEGEPEVEQATMPKSEPAVKVPKQPVAPSAPTPERRDRDSKAMTIIGKGIVIKGELSGEENVKIEGRVEGKIKLTKDLFVGQTGIIEADVEADNIKIGGTVTGNLAAKNRVEIVASGTMEGDIKAPRVVVAEGAHFKGNVDMDTSK